ncbi:hypothetical protein Dda_0041 [Drechslerella dactyloides]|uniref:CST complex subunit Stn1 N-terminal domain-containing protein n=1 Tax=Drechslerella dactyloides TaxID=74499 RepID=A0AAD6NMC8_DREDA|nr:hypothetical protein Dda_0041 [Drechslerella dactyloides]
MRTLEGTLHGSSSRSSSQSAASYPSPRLSVMDPPPAAPLPKLRRINRSETYSRWVKLLLCDIAASLRVIPEYAPRSTFFLHGHPVRWVHVVGTVTRVNEYEKRVVFTIDDGSGQTMDAVAQRSEMKTSIPKMHSIIKARGQLELVHGAFQMQIKELGTGLTLDDQAQFWVQAAESHERLLKQKDDHNVKHVKRQKQGKRKERSEKQQRPSEPS